MFIDTIIERSSLTSHSIYSCSSRATQNGALVFQQSQKFPSSHRSPSEFWSSTHASLCSRLWLVLWTKPNHYSHPFYEALLARGRSCGEPPRNLLSLIVRRRDHYSIYLRFVFILKNTEIRPIYSIYRMTRLFSETASCQLHSLPGGFNNIMRVQRWELRCFALSRVVESANLISYIRVSLAVTC